MKERIEALVANFQQAIDLLDQLIEKEERMEAILDWSAFSANIEETRTQLLHSKEVFTDEDMEIMEDDCSKILETIQKAIDSLDG